jgi:hypothetical protein
MVPLIRLILEYAASPNQDLKRVKNKVVDLLPQNWAPIMLILMEGFQYSGH